MCDPVVLVVYRPSVAAGSFPVAKSLGGEGRYRPRRYGESISVVENLRGGGGGIGGGRGAGTGRGKSGGPGGRRQRRRPDPQPEDGARYWGEGGVRYGYGRMLQEEENERDGAAGLAGGAGRRSIVVRHVAGAGMVQFYCIQRVTL